MKPNIVIIMADQLRADALGDHTPNINALAAEGTVFDRCYCASTLCVPARGSFFTSLYPNETGSIINPWEPLDRLHGDVRSGIPNLYSTLERQWDSWHTGKQHLYTADKIDIYPESTTKWNSLEKGYRPFLAEHDKPAPGGPAYRGVMAEPALNRYTRKVTYSIPTTGRSRSGACCRSSSSTCTAPAICWTSKRPTTTSSSQDPGSSAGDGVVRNDRAFRQE